jgi:hypothetical protein
MNAWLGFFEVLVAPSPKFHRQEVGPPEVVSANCTVCPGPGVVGLWTKVAAEGAGITVRVFVALFEVVPLAAMRVIFRNPEAVKTWTGFLSALVVPSPNSHCQEMGLPAEASAN